MKIRTRCIVRRLTRVPIHMRLTSRFHCHRVPLIGSNLIVIVDRSKRATSALTTVHVTGSGKLTALTIMGMVKDDVTHRTSGIFCALTKPRVSITAAGKCDTRLMTLSYVTIRFTGIGKLVASRRCDCCVSRLRAVPRGVRGILRSGREVR